MSIEHVDRATSKAIYLLGVAPESPADTRDAIQADYSMLEIVSAFELDAWLVRIDREDFDGPAAEKNLADINWLSPRVMAHQMAVQHIANEVALLPMRFGTLFSSEQALIEFLFNHYATIAAFLAGDGRHVEWGIKCYADWSLAVDAFQRNQRSDEADNGAGGGAVGMTYLLKKKLLRERDAALHSWMVERLQPLRDELQRRVVRLADRGVLQDGKGSTRECMANWAVLVPREQQEQLQGWVEEMRLQVLDANDSLSIEMTGPWPPYSFVPTLDSDERRGKAA